MRRILASVGKNQTVGRVSVLSIRLASSGYYPHDVNRVAGSQVV